MLEVYLSVAGIGLMHGLEPGHGWPVAALYAAQRKPAWVWGLWSALVISVFHFLSSLAVVAVYFLMKEAVDFSAPWIRYLAAGALLFLAFRMWNEKGAHGDAQQPSVRSMWGIALFAFFLGFAHEEEFALLALAVGGANPWILMCVYALAVTGSLVVITLLAVYLYTPGEWYMRRITPFLPKITALALVLLAILVLVGTH